MIVNSLAFLWFFIIVLAVYYACQSRKELQNIFLLVCSYWFYSQVDIKMTGLLVVLTVVFWLIGRFIGKAIEQEQERQASLLTTLSVVVGIGALFYFKYLNFFVGSFVAAADVIGLHIQSRAESGSAGTRSYTALYVNLRNGRGHVGHVDPKNGLTLLVVQLHLIHRHIDACVIRAAHAEIGVTDTQTVIARHLQTRCGGQQIR